MLGAEKDAVGVRPPPAPAARLIGYSPPEQSDTVHVIIPTSLHFGL